MVNEIELQFINHIFKDNLLFLKTKINISQLTDPFAKTMFFELGKAMRDYGEMIPSKHLRLLVEDEERISNYNKLKYPLEITDVNSILEYISKYDNDIKFSTLEKTIIDSNMKKEMIELSECLLEDIMDSKKSVKDLLRKYSYAFDTLKYQSADELAFKSTQDMMKDELDYQSSSEVEEYIPTGFNIIDSLYGGIEKSTTNYLLAGNKVGKSQWLYQSLINSLKRQRICLL